MHYDFIAIPDAAVPQAVCIQPGARQLTRTSGAMVKAKLFVKAMTAALTVPNSWPLSPAIPVSAWSHPMLRITPWPRRFINAPSARDGHTAVWTGSQVIVWGGIDDSLTATNSGAASAITPPRRCSSLDWCLAL